MDCHFCCNLIIFSITTHPFQMSHNKLLKLKYLYQKVPWRVNMGTLVLQKIVNYIAWLILMLSSSSIWMIRHQNSPIIFHSHYSPYLFYKTKYFKIYTSTMGPIQIPHKPFLTNITMVNIYRLFLDPTLASTWYFCFFFAGTVTSN